MKPSVRKLFIRKMLISALVQFIVIAVLFVVIKQYLISSDKSSISENLVIKDVFSQQELSKYQVLDNKYAFDLSLHNISERRKLDSVFFSETSPQGKEFDNCNSIGRGGYKFCESEKGVFYGITPLKVRKRTLGYIVASKKYGFIATPTYFGLTIILLIIFSGLTFNFLILFVSIKNKIQKNTNRLLDIMSFNQEASDIGKIDIDEYFKIAEKFIEKKEEIRKLSDEKAYITALKNISDQVAHDIKSPIAAIDSVLKNKNTLTEEGRNVIKSATNTLSDIANNLFLGSKNKADNQLQHSKLCLREESMFLLIDELIHEKKYEYRDKSKTIKIDFQHSPAVINCFTYLNNTELKRALSNIINNSIESLREHGKVSVELTKNDETLVISIIDNGSGIPRDIINKVMLENFSYGKKSGRGLGLFHASKQISKFGGTLTVDSEEGKGTKVSVTLNRCNVPAWFVDKLFVLKEAKIVILDDDKSIHDLWRLRLSSLNNINIQNYYNVDSFILNRSNIIDADLFLIDCHLLGSDETGLDLIKKLNISDRSFLVTSNYFSENIQELCTKHNVKLIPKPCIQLLDISNNTNRSVVLIDDNDSIRLAWKLAAENSEVDLSLFDSTSSFNKHIGDIDREAEIYIDSNLHGRVSGEVYAKCLYDFGFKNIFLSTGKQSKIFDYMYWITKIVGKAPPF